MKTQRFNLPGAKKANVNAIKTIRITLIAFSTVNQRCEKTATISE